jgi:predicted transcriptional regulator of viral defense system
MSNTKTLGAVSADILLRLSGEGKMIFSIAEAQELSGKSYKSTAGLLGQLVKKGWLIRLVPGKYLIVPLEAGLESIPMVDWYVIAREVLGALPHYISYYSALKLHQMTTQPVNMVYITVPRQRTSRTIAGMEYRFVYANKGAFWGSEAFWVTDQEQVQVSDLEKTMLDCAAHPHLCGGIGELAKGIWLRKDDIDENRLSAYAERLDHKAAVKRIGFLLETFSLGRPETISTLQALLNQRYTALDPTVPDEGAYRARWRLQVNLDPAELKAVVWT